MKIRIIQIFLLLKVMSWTLGVVDSSACMSFSVTAKDSSVIIGRTMEFGVDSHWKIVAVSRNTQFSSPGPENRTGMKWQSKYGYVAVLGWGLNDMVADGMNEKGLSFGGLWYEPDVKYESVPPGRESRALAETIIGTWMLGNLSSIDELKTAIKDVIIFSYVVPALGQAPPGHIIVYDASGKSLVIGFDQKGSMQLYDNPLGILTKAPDYPWHIKHLRQYIGMNDQNPNSRDMSGIKLIPTGHGAGMIGLPGDLTPPSRFIRLGMTTYFANQAENAEKSLNLCQHIVNAFNIVKGMAVDRSPEGKVTGS